MEQKKDISYGTNNSFGKGQGNVPDAQSPFNVTRNAATGTPNALTDQTHRDFDSFINKKTEKLTAGLYMVTSFLSDSEPLKWKLRDRSVVLLSDLANVRKDINSEMENVFAQFAHSVEEIIALLEIAAIAKLVSEMNHSVLRKEYLSLKSLLVSNEYAKNRMGRFSFQDNFFLGNDALPPAPIFPEYSIKIENEADRNIPTAPLPDVANEGIKDTMVTQGHNRQTTQNNVPYRSRNPYGGFDKKNTPSSRPQITKTVHSALVPIGRATTWSKGDRRDTILKLFKKGQELMIKDISLNVRGCSEKTIQRELLALVAGGVLNKRGERRWSRYSLK